MTERSLTGGCLCGAVRFELSPPVRDVVICHCSQCAKWTGYAVAAAAVAPQNLKLISGEDDLRWYAATPAAERGFCARCGSSLFWKPADGSRLSVLAGTIDPPTGLTTRAHIFVSGKSDFYEIADDVPQFELGGGAMSNIVKLANLGKPGL